MDKMIGFIGAGQMAQALCKGFINAGVATPSNILIGGQGDNNLRLIAQNGVGIGKDNTEIATKCRILILAVKPYVILDVIRQIREFVTVDHLIISIAIGITLHQMQELLPGGSRVVRVAPNTPAAVMSASSVFAMGLHATVEDAEIVHRLMSSVGSCLRLDEKHLDTVLALTGSGTAYVAMMIESMADGGVKMGLPRDVALKLSAETLLGTAKLLLESGKHPGQLKDAVCSPGGCTIAGLHELEKAGFRGAIINAIETGTLVARQVGKKS